MPAALWAPLCTPALLCIIIDALGNDCWRRNERHWTHWKWNFREQNELLRLEHKKRNKIYTRRALWSLSFFNFAGALSTLRPFILNLDIIAWLGKWPLLLGCWKQKEAELMFFFFSALPRWWVQTNDCMQRWAESSWWDLLVLPTPVLKPTGWFHSLSGSSFLKKTGMTPYLGKATKL